MQLIICAAPAQNARHGAPDHRYVLATHRCNAFRHPVNGKVLSGNLKDGNAVLMHEVVRALCANDEQLEVEALLAGQVIGLLTSVTATALTLNREDCRNVHSLRCRNQWTLLFQY